MNELAGRLMRNIVPTQECWLWQGDRTSNGYARISVAGRKHLAHRVVYELIKGAIPAGLELDHLCRNRLCVNPSHLEAVNHAENVKRGDAPTKLLSVYESRRSLTHCKRGHEFTAVNTGIDHRGHRRCRACMRLLAAKYRQQETQL